MLGGWREDFAGSGEIVRPIAHAMARAHLASGRSVIVPQYLSDSAEVAGLEQIATTNAASFVEVLLYDSRESSVRRLQAASQSGNHDQFSDERQELRDVIAQVVASNGGRRYAETLYDALMAGVSARTPPIRIDSVEGQLDASLALLITATS
jgi:hypothetical protein